MKVDIRRIQKQNKQDYVPGPVLYWMNRDMRLSDNWALLRSQELALKHQTQLLICYNLDPQFLGGTLRQLDFKIKALKQLHIDAQKLNISFYTLVDSGIQCISDFIHKHKVGYVVTDFAPLRIQQGWLEQVNSNIQVQLEVVDAHNIVPCWEASDKKEFAAYTIRHRINKKLNEFLIPFPKPKKQPLTHIAEHAVILNMSVGRREWMRDPLKQLDEVLKTIEVNREVKPVTWCKPGEKEALKVMKHFIKNGHEYAIKRNDPVEDVQSQLSPYLHYGMISAQRIALEINKSKFPFDSREAFLEELIVRRELADNFCYYEKNYDNPKGFHVFFKEEHKRIAKVKRNFIYTREEFEHAHTHDELWNACQMQMLETGKMHGYVRMYWAKMIFAWSKNVAEAMKIAIYLNDTYELDGRDPNGYTGIAWCIGGVHDRPWFITNPVFGKLRYMSRDGMNKKFNSEAYIAKWLNGRLF